MTFRRCILLCIIKTLQMLHIARCCMRVLWFQFDDEVRSLGARTASHNAVIYWCLLYLILCANQGLMYILMTHSVGGACQL
jgi:hypothetical protein